MFSLSIWNCESELKTLAYLDKLDPVVMGLTSDFILISTSANSLQRFEYTQIEVPQNLTIQETVLEISCNLQLALIISQKTAWMLGCDTAHSGLFAKEGVYESKIPIKIDLECKNDLLSACLADSHAAVLCTEGILYTWGTGHYGELEQLKTTSLATPVNRNPTFKGKKVLTGHSFTAILTQGGHLYQYNSPINCACSPINIQLPYKIPSLEDHFISSAITTPTGLALLTSTGKIFLSKGCLCIIYLQANKKISQLASSSKGLFGLSTDKSRLYCWENINGEYQSNGFSNPGKIFSLFSTSGPFLGVLGEGLNEFPGDAYNENSSPEPSPKYCEQDKKMIESILGKYKFNRSFSHDEVLKEEACKEIMQFMVRYLAVGFRKIREFVYVQEMMRRAYSNSIVLSSLVKVCGKVELGLKEFAFLCIEKFAEVGCGRFKVVECSGFMLLRNMMDKRRKKFFWKIMKHGYREAYLKNCETRVFRQKKMTESGVLKDFRFGKHPILLVIKVMNSKFGARIRSAFSKWVSILPIASSLRPIQKLIEKRLRNTFLYFFQEPLISTQSKYGLYFLSASISKLQTKQKSYSFNSILRHKSKKSYLSILSLAFNRLSRPILSNSFNQIRLSSITQNHRKTIRLVMLYQSQIEKFKYRMIIKGFNSFKKANFYKPTLSDISSERSFAIRNFFKLRPNCKHESPSLEMTMPNTERSTLETSSGSCARVSSLHSFQEILARKYSDKPSSESKSSILMKNKVSAEKEKISLKGKESRLDKRMAYDEVLKERMRKKIIGKGNNFINSSKTNSLIGNKVDYINRKQWMSKKYCDATKVLEELLKKILRNKIKLSFGLLNHCINKLDLKYKIIESQKGPEKNTRELKIRTNNLGLAKLEVGHNVCYSPIESPITIVNEDTFIIPPTPFVDIISPKSVETYQISLWKIKLYTLGLNKLRKTLRLVVKRKLFFGLNNS